MYGYFGYNSEKVVMERYLEKQIQDDLKKKIVLLTGPRQAGKTTLAKMLEDSFHYLNFDNAEHRLRFIEKSWDRSKNLTVIIWLQLANFIPQFFKPGAVNR